MTEARLQKQCIAYAKENNVLAYKVDSTSSRGFPDLTCVLPNGTVLFCELKTETGVLSALQKRMIKKIKANRGNAYVIRSKEEFIRVIASFS